MKVILTENELVDAVAMYLEEEYPGMLVEAITLKTGVDEDGFEEYRAKAELVEDPDAI